MAECSHSEVLPLPLGVITVWQLLAETVRLALVSTAAVRDRPSRR